MIYIIDALNILVIYQIHPKKWLIFPVMLSTALSKYDCINIHRSQGLVMSLYSSIDMFWFVQNNLIIRAANFVMSTKTFFCNVIVSTSFNVLHFYNGIVEFGLELKLSNDKRHWYQHSYLNLFFVLKRSIYSCLFKITISLKLDKDIRF